MSWRPDLVALDVDGTVVDHENHMSPAVRETVNALRDSGVEVVISTGRAVPGVLNCAEKLGFDGYAVGSNGALVMSYQPLEILNAVTFDASAAVRRIVEAIPEALIAVEEIGVGYRISAPFPAGEINGEMKVQTIEELIAEPVTRVVVRAPERSVEEFHALADDLGLDDTNYYVGYTAWLDIAPKGVSKASGLDWLCERLGVDRTGVLAIGDGLNDLEMLQWAGRGVAMGQAPDALKDAADAVTGTVHEDGVAQELRRYL